MRFGCFDLGIDLFLEENKVTVLVIECPEVYTAFMEKISLFPEEGSELLLTEGEKELSFKKYVEIIQTPFWIDFNTKKLLSHLYREMDEVSNLHLPNVMPQINTEIIHYLDALTAKLPYAIKFNVAIEPLELFKQYDVRFDLESQSLIERVIQYIQLLKMLCGTKLIVFINIKAYFNGEQLKELYKAAFYSKIQLLLLETMEKDCLPNEKYCIIDKDRCLIMHG